MKFKFSTLLLIAALSAACFALGRRALRAHTAPVGLTAASDKKTHPRPARSRKETEEPNRRNGTEWTVLWRGNPVRKEIALTFDDGPHPPFTQRLLDCLKAQGVHATFFVVGKKLALCPELARRMLAEGHEVGNHTYNHINLGKAAPELRASEIRQGSDAIERATGHKPRFFRPPGGHHEPSVLQAVEAQEQTTVLWTDDPADFANPGADVIKDRLLAHVHNGAIILLHDGIEQTLSILPDLIARLRREGYVFVTLSELTAHLETNLSVRK